MDFCRDNNRIALPYKRSVKSSRCRVHREKKEELPRDNAFCLPHSSHSNILNGKASYLLRILTTLLWLAWVAACRLHSTPRRPPLSVAAGSRCTGVERPNRARRSPLPPPCRNLIPDIHTDKCNQSGGGKI